MSNKPKKTVDWFPHKCLYKDSMKIVENTWREKGYACWFKLLERLGATEDHYLHMESDRKKLMLLWSEAGLSPEDGKNVMDLFAHLGMIDEALYIQGTVWSQNFIDGISVVYSKRSNDLPLKPIPDTHIPIPSTGNAFSSPEQTGREVERREVEEDYCEQPLLEPEPEVKECLSILSSVKGYPLDLNKDSEYLAGLIAEFKEHDPVEIVKDWKVYISDKPFKKNDNHRTQLRNTFKFNRKYGKCKREVKESHSTGLIDEIRRDMEEHERNPK